MPAKILFLLAGGLLLCSCNSLPQRDFFAQLPLKSQSATTTLHPHPDYKPLLSYSFYREGQHAIVDITYGPDFRSKGYQLVPLLKRRAYGSLWGHSRTESVADCAGTPSPGTLRLCIPAERLRHSGGPWDYTLCLDLLTPDGETEQYIEARLYDECPEPGALRHNPALFDRTYSRNSQNLQRLQQAAARCSAVRVRSEDFHTGKTTETLLSTADAATIRHLIGRMQPVHTQILIANPSGSCTLQLLDANGEKLDELSVYSVARADKISPENVGRQKLYKLSNEDADVWYHLIEDVLK